LQAKNVQPSNLQPSTKKDRGAKMDHKAIVVLITTPSKEVGKEIASALLEQKLAACVNIISPVNSLYFWEGQTHDDEEALLVVKTRLELFTDRLVRAVKEIHPYELPEIIALPVVMGLDGYLDWIDEVTSDQ
jgi:periplasmic divalent cation tolerance protein